MRYVQAEGGAGFNGSLLDADVIDELDLSLSPHLVGGDGPRLTTGATESLRGRSSWRTCSPTRRLRVQPLAPSLLSSSSSLWKSDAASKFL